MVSSRAIIVIVVVIALLVALVLVMNSEVSGASTGVTITSTQTVGATTTITTTFPAPSSSNGSSASASINGINAEQIYASANLSIVILQGLQAQSSLFGGTQYVSILGSGFAVQYSGSDYIVTNYHVAGATTNLTVTFSDGNAYPATVVGSDPYADLAIVSARQAPASEFHPLTIAPSSTLLVGQPIVAIGAPFGLSGSMTVGIISQLGRTLQDPTAGNFSIAAAIQFSAPINPGNSGGPLLDSNGEVIGITTAVVQSSQGVGFAIPSDTILKELPSLVTTGSYNQHSYLGIGGTDMNYQLSRASGTNITYGVLIENVVAGGPASQAGLRAGSRMVTIAGEQFLVGGDIIVSINGTRIINNDALATYLEEHTVSGQTITLGIIRDGQPALVNLMLGTRPAISS